VQENDRTHRAWDDCPRQRTAAVGGHRAPAVAREIRPTAQAIAGKGNRKRSNHFLRVRMRIAFPGPVERRTAAPISDPDLQMQEVVS
jgi:hypothetical protein